MIANIMFMLSEGAFVGVEVGGDLGNDNAESRALTAGHHDSRLGFPLHFKLQVGYNHGLSFRWLLLTTKHGSPILLLFCPLPVLLCPSLSLS